MFSTLFRKILGTKNERVLKGLAPLVDAINGLEDGVRSLSDEALRAKTGEFKERLAGGATLDDLLPEAFAVVRETSRRVLGMRHFDVQLIGGIVLHQGNIAEMKTGEGKTLVATLPVYLNALEGKGVHVVTVNDYLARRDSEWMKPIYSFLGMNVGVIVHGLTDAERQEAYGADITYGTNNEFGFDYLRDNMKFDIADYVQRGHHYAIVDEVDSILIDEARTPLIISGPSEVSTGKYYEVNRIIPRLKAELHYTVEEKSKTAALTEEGVAKVEELLKVENLYDPAHIDLVHHVVKGLIAHTMYKRDVEYMVKDGEVIIVDEFTGRLMPGRRWSDGLHQAIEAKEGVKIESENQTLASITFQNYFRMYDKLAGMTGTADTEAPEFGKIYDLDVVVVPTNKPMVRQDFPDVVYATENGKFNALIDEIADCNERGQPVLVGTISIENSERLSSMLKRRKIPHSVLNAKYHEKEAEIVAQAGRRGAVTIATNMAGRGTDIVLGGNPEGIARELLRGKDNPSDEDMADALARAERQCEQEREDVVRAGGLHILGTERHESRRIDNQLRGRSGRQGDPGSSRFYLSLEDDLMRIFGSERIQGLMGKLGMDDTVPIENKMVSRAIENAQKKVEAHNFDIRKHLLEYDDVMNKQRQEIYDFRREILQADNLGEQILEMAEDRVGLLVDIHCPEDRHPEDWDLEGLSAAVATQFGFPVEVTARGREAVEDEINAVVRAAYKRKTEELGPELMKFLEKELLLRAIDMQWKDHLLSIDHLKEGIGLRGYGQRDPVVEYKKEAFELFADLGDRIASETVAKLFKIQVAREEELRESVAPPRQVEMNLYNSTAGGGGGTRTVVRKKDKVGRNAPCPCGSGKKFKKCCGVNA